MEALVILPPVFKGHEIRHLDEPDKGWHVTESRHFRLFHNAPKPVAEKLVTVAEETKARAQQHWFDGQLPNWPRRLPIYLYPDGETYSRATGYSPLRPGYATIRTEDARMVGGKIDMHFDGGNYLTSVLPHEVTHAVVGSNFSRTPRWADEGMAMLSESPKHIATYLKAVGLSRKKNELLTVTTLLQLKDYPADETRRFSFYCQSASLVDFLVNQKTAKTFVQFVRDSYRQGYAAALIQNYGFSDFEDLERRWLAASAGKKARR